MGTHQRQTSSQLQNHKATSILNSVSTSAQGQKRGICIAECGIYTPRLGIYAPVFESTLQH